MIIEVVQEYDLSALLLPMDRVLHHPGEADQAWEE